MGMETIPVPSNTERNRNAAGRAQMDDAWAEQLNGEASVKTKEAPVEVTDIYAEVVSTENLDNVARKAEVQAELQTLQESVAVEKAKRAIVASKVKALLGMVNSPVAGENAAETGKMIEDLKTAQGELRDLDVTMLRAEQSLATREADYRRDFPEVVN